MFGFKHCIMTKYIDEIRIKALIESQTKKVCVRENKTLNYDMLENLRNSTTKFISESNKAYANNKNKAIHRTLVNLFRNLNIRCLNMDKRDGVVIMNTSNNTIKINEILKGIRKFKNLKFDRKLQQLQQIIIVLVSKTVYRLVYIYI